MAIMDLPEESVVLRERNNNKFARTEFPDGEMSTHRAEEKVRREILPYLEVIQASYGTAEEADWRDAMEEAIREMETAEHIFVRISTDSMFRVVEVWCRVYIYLYPSEEKIEVRHLVTSFRP